MSSAERIAQEFHAAYEHLASEHGYATREASAKPWHEVPEQNRNLMIATVQHLLDRGAIACPNEEGQAMTAEYELPNSGVTLRPNPATVGRIVHYTSYPTEHEDKACCAALVTIDEDVEGRVGLRVFHPVASECLTNVEGHHIVEDNPSDMRSTRGVSGRQPGTWHWPERV